MKNEAYNTYVVKYTPKKSNLDAVCRQIAEEGITYAEYQKRQYRAFYDVKSTIKLDISINNEISFRRQYERELKERENWIYTDTDSLKVKKLEVRVFKERR